MNKYLIPLLFLVVSCTFKNAEEGLYNTEFCYKGFVYVDRGFAYRLRTFPVFNMYGQPMRCEKDKK